MPKTFTVPFTQNVNSQVPQTFVPADTTNIKTCYTAGSNDSVVKAIIVTSTDTSTKDMQFYFSDGTSNFPLHRLAIPIGAGTVVGTPATNVLSAIAGLPMDELGNRVLRMRNGFQIRANCVTAVTAATQINVIVLGEDY
jgi:hypothetical protein